ncbi:lasso peptide biosynthesis PqqD family chaperone [Amycolatopsis anabasis]|uniref:lasso peptide biosynthesis PqqD family chaperone n=1 Tax=Amycolatopsis anabasis TaxID=1840409 RepID=UPI00131C7BE3|nr:lasso peptide biosynthesis PqqD family chaperone [Amycolatopsis anabasis]
MSPRLRPDIATTDTEHGIVLLDGRTGRYYQLNPTGTRILHALEAGHTPEQIATQLADLHHLDPDQARHDVEAITTHLHTANLLENP